MTDYLADAAELCSARPSRNYRRSDPLTSRDAGISAAQFVSDHHQKILNALRQADRPLAAEEIAERTSIDYVQVGKRTHELLDAGKIERTQLIHINRSGRKAFKYRLRAQP